MRFVNMQSFHDENPRSSQGRQSSPLQPQEGVVLIVALIMLVIISLLATFSIRNAVSTEAVSGNVRTTQLATQAAEAALRYCEDGVAQSFAGTPTFTITPISAYAPSPRWQDLANWDGSTSVTNALVIVVPTTVVGGSATYQRTPECMVERMNVVNSSGAVSSTSTFVVTARGFGPEVAATDATRSRPIGSEAWMQSTISFK
jgi:type IV pilus assembly protein PilX